MDRQGPILVTGCAGFIGSTVCQVLLDEGYLVFGIDNMNHDYDIRLKQWRLGQLEKQAAFRFQVADISDKDSLWKIFQSKPRAVISLAARAGVRRSLEDPWSYVHTNIAGTLTLLEMCRQEGVKKLVVASSSSVYGAGASGPSREDADTAHPLSPYAASKKGAEVLCYAYHHLYQIDISVLRYFTVYGPAGRPDMSLFRFIRWVFEGDPVVVYGDGAQKRDFTYVDDAARGTVLALRDVGYQVINLGSNHPWQLRDVLGIVEKLVGKAALIQYKPASSADVLATWADISKAQRLLNWHPQISLENGLGRAVEWYRQNRSWGRDLALD